MRKSILWLCSFVLLFAGYVAPVNAATSSLQFTETFDALNTGSLNGQNGWVAASGDPWDVVVADSGKKAQGGNSVYNSAAMSQTSAQHTNTRIKVDFRDATGGAHAWLRRDGASSTDAGYDLFYYSDGKLYLDFIDGSTITAFTSATVSVTANQWYTLEFEAENNESGEPVLKGWIYAQGDSRPVTPNITYTDTSKKITGAGYAGFGSHSNEIEIDNVYIYSDVSSGTSVPDAPSSVSASSGNGQVALSWSAPNSNGSTITDYIVDYKLSATSTWSTFADGTSTTTNTTITGLTNGEAYNFRVSAVNGEGTSDASSIATSTPFDIASITTPTLLGNAYASGSGGGTTSSIDTTGATLLVVTMGVYSVDTSSVSISDSEGNTWNALTSRSGTNNIRTGIWYAYSKSGGNLSTSGSHTVTVTASAKYPAFHFSAWGGVATSSPFSAETGTGGNGTTITASSITPSEDNMLIISSFGADTAGTYSAVSPHTALRSTSYAAGSNMGNALGYQVQTNATAVTPSWGMTSSGNLAVAVATFKAIDGTVDPTAPEAPGSLAATAGGHEVSLTWATPSDGGSDITDYVIQYQTGGGSYSTFSDGISTATSTTVTGLSLSTAYTFRVYAQNAVGDGSAATVVATTTSRVISITTPTRDVSASSTVATLGISRTECSTTFYVPYIQTSSTLSAVATVDASALPSGGGVKFVLTDSNSNETVTYDMLSPFSVSFSSLTKDEYTLDTYVVDASQEVQSGSQYHDTATNIGIGDIFVAIGDSVTEGYDGTAYNVSPYTDWTDVPTVSNDGRNYPQCGISSGYYQDHWQEVSHHIALNDTLSDYYGYPVFILNEGVAGITSGGYVTRTGLSTWQDRMNTLAPSKWLLHLGINDGGGSATYQSNMQTLINTLITTYNTASSSVVLAVPAVRSGWTTYVNNLISNNSITRGPDFNTFYANNTSPTLYSGVHPNAAGHVEMGRLWGLSIIAPQNVSARQVGTSTLSVSWDDLSSIESSIAGYRMYYGTNSEVLNTVVDVGNATSTSLNSGLVDGATYYFKVQGYDDDAYVVNNTATSSVASATYSADTTEPTISAVSASVSTTSASVSWITDEAASTRVQYGPMRSPNTYTIESDTGTRVTSHSAALSDLASCTTYFYRVASRDASLNTATSSLSSFTTTGCTANSSIATTTTAQITAASGGAINLFDDGSLHGVSLTVPASFTGTSSEATFQAKRLDTSTFFAGVAKPSGREPIGTLLYNLSALTDATTTLSVFDQSLTVTFSYDDSEVSSYDESSLLIYRYDSGTWAALSNCSVDTAANTVSCETDHFSDFGLFGTSATSSSSSATVGNGMIYTGPNEQLPGYMMPRQQIMYPDGTIVYLDELTASSSDASGATGTIFTRDLSYGLGGSDVRALQEYLNAHGFVVASSGPGSPGNETTYFGSATQAALRRFQTAQGITPAVGYFGPKTRAAFRAVSNGIHAPPAQSTDDHMFSVPLHFGMTDSQVYLLQKFLNLDSDTLIADSGPGSPGRETDYFGVLTLNAVQRFQVKYGISSEDDEAFGYVGPMTRKTLNQLSR